MRSTHTKKTTPKKHTSQPKGSKPNPPKKPAPGEVNEKIQKVLANAGVGSRRQVEDWILDGLVVVNGKKAKIGDRITYQAKVSVNGREINLVESQDQRPRVILYHKPEGELCTRSDPEDRPTIFNRMPIIRNNRWICIGRLDYNTSGILLITNNGELANKMMHPSSDIEREYAVRVKGEVNDRQLEKLRKGVRLEDGIAKFETLVDAGGHGKNHWYHVTVKEGRNRMVRRLWEHFNLTVSRLIRVRFGIVALPEHLRRGQYMELTEKEVAELIDFLNGVGKR